MLSQSQILAEWAPRCKGPWAKVSLHGRGVVSVRAAAIEATKALNNCLVSWNYLTRAADTGAYVCRAKVSGNGWSVHAYGVAIDINWQLNPYGGSRHHIPSGLAAAICRIRTNNGKQVWNWGGYWNGTRDWMHFEVVCRPEDLATGINWSTVPGNPGISKPTTPTVSNPTVPKEEDEEMTVFIRLNEPGNPYHGRVEEVGSFDRRHITKSDELKATEFLLALSGKSVKNVSGKDFSILTRNKRIVNTGQ